MKHLILASASPRRKELLQMLRLSFQITTCHVDEHYNPSLTPKEIVQDLAFRKANAVAKDHNNATVIGADTIVVYETEILGKPKSYQEAVEMLRKLSGNTHTVYTGVAIVQNKKTAIFYEKTDVSFWKLTEEEIDLYVKSGEPFDKAGGYGIQQFGATLVKKINGDYFTVVGLPVAKTMRALQEFGF